MVKADVPVIGFAAFSATGKTTLICRLLPLLKARNLDVGVIKHTHHRFEMDKPGKDSFKLREAGANQLLITSPYRLALIVEKAESGEPLLQDALDRLDQSALDLILVEGFKHEALPKIELFRPSLGKPPSYPDDPDVIAVASDSELPRPTVLPVFDLNDIEAIAGFILDRIEKGRKA